MAMGSASGCVWRSPLSFSCSSASSTTSSSSNDDVADRMVKIELEAAEALADLAHLAVSLESSGGTGCDSPGEWGSKGKRAKKRVKSESPPADSALNNSNPPLVLDSVPTSSDLAEDQTVASLQQCEKICTSVFKEPEKDEQDPSKTDSKDEQDSELPKPTPNRKTSYASFGFRKSRRNLTEAEKEERRIRRVLANRESARQTIRRRQALCEELTRKAADLQWENENLKREKELALKKYQSLEIANKLLKKQMVKAIKVEVEETPPEHKSADVATSTSTSSSTNCPLFLYNRPPLMPIFWPSIIPSQNPVPSLHGRQSAPVIPSNIDMPGTCRPDISPGQDNHMDVNGPRTPFYVLPYPWFFPLPDHGNGLQPHPSIGMENKQDETSHNNQYSASSSSITVHVENHHCSLPIKVKTEATASTEARPTNDLNKTPVGCPSDGGGQHTVVHSKEMLFTPALQDCVQPASTVNHENRLQSDYTLSEKPSKSCHIVTALPEKKQESAIYSNKKLTDAVAAAEARKRRKELTKIKNLNGRQCRMHC